MANDYKGARWFKCDLHLHTTASLCFKDKLVTPNDWINAVISAGLDCIAITDHNTAAGIDLIRDAARDKNIVVFPGVEITCDTSKIHLLVIFDIDKTKQDIEDFLIKCGINRDMFAKAEAHSQKTVIEISNIANEEGALVIPAHIDEFNGLGYCAGRASVEEFLNLNYINSVQIVHKEFLDPTLKIKDNDEIVEHINSYYNNPAIPIGLESIKKAYDGVSIARNKGVKFLTFSDNPDIEEPSKHGINGIGARYTWIKMDNSPSLESMRQAFLMNDRTRNCFESPQIPYNTPSLWIKQIKIQNTSLTKKDNVFSIDFNPQLTTIIGGRGSGKSSILRFLRGVFNQEKDLEGLNDILVDHQEFFKKIDNNGRGVLKDNTRIEVYFIRDGLQYRVVYNRSNAPMTIVERWNYGTNLYEEITDVGFIEFFKFEQYSQKQIFSIAQRPNSLRNRIDNAVNGFSRLETDYKQKQELYKSLMANKRALIESIKNKGKIKTELKDLESKITILKQSGISEIITKEQLFAEQQNHISAYASHVKDLLTSLRDYLPTLGDTTEFDSSAIDEAYKQEIQQIFEDSYKQIISTKEILKNEIAKLDEFCKNQDIRISASTLYKEAETSHNLFKSKQVELEEKGITDMSDFEKYSNLIAEKKIELAAIERKEEELAALEEQLTHIETDCFSARHQLTLARKEFVESVINSEKIKVTITPFGDSKDFENQFRRITQKNSGFERGIEYALNLVYANNGRDILNGLKTFKKDIHEIHGHKYTGENYDGRFVNMIEALTDGQMDLLDLLYPEDEVEMKYKNRDGNFKPLAIASAGQKTTAVLSFILSFGDNPLILDQPEDDLDNRLVYDLIVDKISKIKENRQVIIVTHNANIPVNGDAEYIVSMSSDGHNLKIQAEGTVEKIDVKKEICEVMEGGVEAFNTRAKRYSSIKN